MEATSESGLHQPKHDKVRLSDYKLIFGTFLPGTVWIGQSTGIRKFGTLFPARSRGGSPCALWLCEMSSHKHPVFENFQFVHVKCLPFAISRRGEAVCRNDAQRLV